MGNTCAIPEYCHPSRNSDEGEDRRVLQNPIAKSNYSSAQSLSLKIHKKPYENHILQTSEKNPPLNEDPMVEKDSHLLISSDV